MQTVPEVIIEREHVSALLKEAVEAYGPDYVDPNIGSCAYVYDGVEDGAVGRHCIVGWVLNKLGLPFPERNLMFISAWEDGLYPQFTQEAMLLLDAAQNKQDIGTEWGRAVADAEAMADQSVEDLRAEELAQGDDEDDDGWSEQYAHEIEQTERSLHPALV